MNNNHRRLSFVLALSTPLLIWAADVTLPHVFQAGNPIRASEMNDNFATLRDAVNTKADKSAVLISGTRLKRIGYRMADGTTEDAAVLLFSGASPAHIYFDTVDNRHCFTQPGLLDSQGKARCFPFWGFGSAGAYLDAQCTMAADVVMAGNFGAQLAQLGEARVPGDDQLAAETSGGNTLRYFRVGAAHMTVLYGLDCGTCCQKSGTFFDRGAEVDPSTFIELTPARF